MSGDSFILIVYFQHRDLVCSSCSKTVGNCIKRVTIRYELLKLLSNIKIDLIGDPLRTQTFLYPALEITKTYHQLINQLFPLPTYH